jgi:hypothetical protein
LSPPSRAAAGADESKIGKMMTIKQHKFFAFILCPLHAILVPHIMGLHPKSGPAIRNREYCAMDCLFLPSLVQNSFKENLRYVMSIEQEMKCA